MESLPARHVDGCPQLPFPSPTTVTRESSNLLPHDRHPPDRAVQPKPRERDAPSHAGYASLPRSWEDPPSSGPRHATLCCLLRPLIPVPSISQTYMCLAIMTSPSPRTDSHPPNPTPLKPSSISRQRRNTAQVLNGCERGDSLLGIALRWHALSISVTPTCSSSAHYPYNPSSRLLSPGSSRPARWTGHLPNPP